MSAIGTKRTWLVHCTWYVKNWLQTNPGKSWFAYFRLYGPLEPYLNRSWKLPDFEDVAQTTGAK